jgi:hypothetical protein
VTLRYRRKLHHISVGQAHRHQRVIILQTDLDIRVVTDAGELLRHFTLDPTGTTKRGREVVSEGSIVPETPLDHMV